MKRLTILAAAIVLVLASAAQAKTLVSPQAGTFPYQRWVDQAKVPTPDVQLFIVEDEYCPYFPSAACTEFSSRKIWLPVAPNWSPRYRRLTLYHEIGHWVVGVDEAEASRYAACALYRRLAKHEISSCAPWR